MFQPREFFEGITWDGGWRDPLLFFAVCAAAYSLMLSTVLTLTLGGFAASDPQFPAEVKGMIFPGYFVISFLALFVCAMLGSLTMSFVTTIALHFLGGTGSFQRTYTVLSCCWIVMLVTWIPLIGWIPGLYFFYLAYLGLSKAHEVPGWKGIAGLFIGPGVLTLVVGGLLVVATILQVVSAVGRGVTDPRSLNEPADPAMRAIMDRYSKQ